MKVEFLGTGAAEGVPALFCNCEYCRGAKRRGGKEIRSRAQTLYGGELSVDFPPDAFYHAALLGADLSAIRYLLVTHSHMDHFNGSDLVLRGYKYAHDMTSEDLTVFCNAEVAEVFREETRREIKAEVAEHIHIVPVHAFDRLSFGGWTAEALPAQHTSREPFVYLLEKDGKRALHLCDTGILPEETFRRLREIGGPPADLVTLDGTLLFFETLPGSRHMGLDKVAETLSRLEADGVADGHTKRVITHFSHNAAPSEERLARAEAEYGVIAAYDGMTIEI